eukprot:scaffold1867_cov122-Cylindrotheca_fusiformis.AAC.1
MASAMGCFGAKKCYCFLATKRPFSSNSGKSHSESSMAYKQGDHPVTMVHSFGASAWNPTGGNATDSSTTFRWVKDRGTQFFGW